MPDTHPGTIPANHGCNQHRKADEGAHHEVAETIATSQHLREQRTSDAERHQGECTGPPPPSKDSDRGHTDHDEAQKHRNHHLTALPSC